MDPITVVIQLVFGWLVKKWPALKGWPNRLIPVFNFVLALLIQLAGVVTDAHAGTGVLKATGSWLWGVLGPALLNTLISTGIFSTGKNIQQHITKT